MDSTIRVLIADDNEDLCQLVGQYLRQQDDFSFLGAVHDGRSLMDRLEEEVPDIILLDIVMPRLDGIAVLESLKAFPEERRPKVLVLTAFGQEQVTRQASQLGADYFVLKPFDLNMLGRRIREVVRGINNELYPPLADEAENAHSRAVDPNQEITTIIQKVGVPANIKGYRYLRAAIGLVVEHPDLMESVTKQLYPAVAEKFDTTPTRVERAIRHAIEVAYNRGNAELIGRYFGYPEGSERTKPTNSEFIALIADRVRMRVAHQ